MYIDSRLKTSSRTKEERKKEFLKHLNDENKFESIWQRGNLKHSDVVNEAKQILLIITRHSR